MDRMTLPLRPVETGIGRHGPHGEDATIHAVLFDADGTDRSVPIDSVDLHSLSERQLLWIDLNLAEDANDLQRLQSLGLSAAKEALGTGEAQPRLRNFGDWFLINVVTVNGGKGKFDSQPLSLISGRNFVVTLHRQPLAYLEQLHDRERGETQLGILSAEGFTASLLDWVLTTYFDAVGALEAEADRLEVHVLTRRVQREDLPDLARLRRDASRLRRMLEPHRTVFNALARPDFRPDQDEKTNALFIALNERFERSLDAIETARDLVVGSFELFATRTALRTNETMRVLTFFTVLLGTLAVVAGVLGMNFPASFFDEGDLGFAIAVAAMALLVIAALVLARWRRWW